MQGTERGARRRAPSGRALAGATPRGGGSARREPAAISQGGELVDALTLDLLDPFLGAVLRLIRLVVLVERATHEVVAAD